jgi:hypothetical protein
MPSLTDIPTTALVYRRMIAAMRPALALPALLILHINPAKPDSQLTAIYTAYGEPFYLLTLYEHLLLPAYCALHGHGLGRRAESLPTASNLPNRGR